MKTHDPECVACGAKRSEHPVPKDTIDPRFLLPGCKGCYRDVDLKK